MPANGRVGRVALAKLAGVHPDRISVFTRDGMPVVTRGGHGNESAYDPLKCLAWICQRRAIGNAKERYYEELAEREKRANALRAGAVCDRAAVLSMTHAIIVQARDAALGFASRVKTAEPSVSVSVCVTIERLVHELLAELADGLATVPPTPSPARGDRDTVSRPHSAPHSATVPPTPAAGAGASTLQQGENGPPARRRRTRGGRPRVQPPVPAAP